MWRHCEYKENEIFQQRIIHFVPVSLNYRILSRDPARVIPLIQRLELDRVPFVFNQSISHSEVDEWPRRVLKSAQIKK